MKRMKLFPKIRPYRHGYLNVGDGHKLYYELCGNPKGKPVLYVHGGPGAGCSEKDRQFFNPKAWNIILFDQRGANRSKPFGSLKANTTWKLVSDIRQLLRFLNIGKVFLFGGSWGSTLSLVYAIKHPGTVTGMLLRGIFLGRKEDILYTYGGGAEDYFPEAWERFASHVPQRYRNDVISYYMRQMQSKNRKISNKFAFEFAYYELSLLKLKMTHRDVMKIMGKKSSHPGHKSMAIIESYYMKNNCFLPKNYILSNARRVAKAKIPVTIVQGRYDALCPPAQAWLLHKALPKSKLVFAISGHGSGDSPLTVKLVEEMKRFGRTIKN
ncbi:prolyl aminopeptidase [Candidatus Woesearchaeota archaeon]|nr:prolyl aminopeptidase [Candidatus Woesearchaeota archaeon]